MLLQLNMRRVSREKTPASQSSCAAYALIPMGVMLRIAFQDMEQEQILSIFPCSTVLNDCPRTEIVAPAYSLPDYLVKLLLNLQHSLFLLPRSLHKALSKDNFPPTKTHSDPPQNT